MKIDGSYREEHELRDGTRVTIRMLRRDDREALRAVFARLSPESRYRRFLSGTAAITEEALDYLTDVDGVNHVAMIALRESLDLKEEIIVGVARFVRLKDHPEVAEVAITVIDDLHNLGLAKILTAPARVAAIERGITHFRAEVLLSNLPMRHLLQQTRARTVDQTADTLVFDVPLVDQEQDHRPAYQRVLAAAAGSMAVFIRRLAPTD